MTREEPPKLDLYRDSEERYRHDVHFRTIVDMLYHAILTYGYTPGELRQIAFYASLRAERYSTELAREVKP